MVYVHKNVHLKQEIQMVELLQEEVKQFWNYMKRKAA